MEGVVQGCYCHDYKTDDESGLQQREYCSEKLVEPSEHDYVYDALQKSSDCVDAYGHSYEYKCECDDLEHLLRCCYPLTYPFSEHGGKFKGNPHADDNCDDCYRLTDESFSHSLDECRDETKQKNDIQYVHSFV